MSIFSLVCPDIGCYQNYLCDPEFQNKIIAVAFVKKSYASNIDKSNAEDWEYSLFSAYLIGEAYLVLNTSGEKPKPDTATTAGRGLQTTKALPKTHTVTYQDMQGVVLSNVEFYNDILATAQNYDFYYFTPDRIWDASGNYVTVIGDPIIAADINTYQMAEVSVMWTSKGNPLPFEFDTTGFLQGLFYELSLSTNGTTISLATGATGNDTILQQLSQPVGGVTTPNVLFTTTASGATITALGLSVTGNGASGTISWASVQAGTYEVKIQATNAFGCVYGELVVTFVVN